MKHLIKGKIYFIILIIPLILIGYSLLMKKAVGPFYFNAQYDPSYVYLISSLNISQMESPEHVDHPGTPVQLAGAIAVKLLYYFDGESDSIAEDVLRYSEFYLNYILFFFVILNAVILFFAALLIYGSTKSIPATLLIQLSPFLSFSISYSFFSVSAEIFLIPVCMLLVAYSFKYVFESSENKVKYLLIFSLLCGIGLAVKINFFPLLIIPLILIKEYSGKIMFLILTPISFLIATIPVISKSEYFINWTGNLFLKDGIYGTGSNSIIDADLFFENLFKIFSSEILFTVIFAIMFFTIIAYISQRGKSDSDIQMRKVFRLLVAVFIAVSFQIILVAKHYNNRYMLPGLILAMAGLYLCVLINKKLFRQQLRNISYNFIFVTIIILVSAVTIKNTINNYIGLKAVTDDTQKLFVSVNDKLKGNLTINSFGVSSKEYALAFCTHYAGEKSDDYKKMIEDLYPGNLYFEPWNKEIYSLSDETVSDKLLSAGDMIYIRSNSEKDTEIILKELKNTYGISDPELSMIGSTDLGEFVYELKIRK